MPPDDRPLTPAEWGEVRALLEGADDVSRDAWDAYVDGSGASDRVRREVRELLAERDDSWMRSSALPSPRPESPGTDLPPETRVGHYVIIRRLGGGGMGTVYLARDERLNRDVALKVLRRQPDQRARDRLLREARAVAALDHPSICAVHEVGTDPVVGDFLVMPYIEGGTLAERLREGPLRVTEAVMVCRQLAEALAVAHARGIVHRDLKPQNVAMDASGRPRLLDFGIAQAVRPVVDAAAMTTQVTEAGAIVGTPSYMSPEQIRGERVDARSDLFALGCVFYECLTGFRAFDGQTPQEICGKVLHVSPPPPSSLRPDLAAEHDRLCLRLLEREPARRFQSAQEASGALRLLEAGSPAPVPAPPDVPWWRRPLVGLAAGLVLTAVLALTQAYWPKRLPEAPPEARHWYEQGVDALRSDSFAVALSRLQEAVRLFPEYVEAHARIAEAHAAMDDHSAAKDALLIIDGLVPNESLLATDDRLRVLAIRAAVIGRHDDALAAHYELKSRHPDDPGVSLDLARALDAAGHWAEARDLLQRTSAQSPQSAAARLQLGILQSRLGERDSGLASIDEAIRLYRTEANVEGEAEGWLRRGTAAGGGAQFDEAEDALENVMQLTRDERYAVQRLRAQFELAVVMSWRGHAEEAQAKAQEAVSEATHRRLYRLAASGLITLARSLFAAGKHGEARAELRRAVELAERADAQHTAMQARLQDAAIVVQDGQPAGAIEVAESVRRFAEQNGFVLMQADAQSILARAYAYERRFDNAAQLADSLVDLAERGGDDLLLTDALETLSAIRAAQGQLSVALAHQRRLTTLYRERRDAYALPASLVNEAELLTFLGRGQEGQALLDEVKAGIEAGHQSYRQRVRRVALVEAMRATLESRWVDAERFAGHAIAADNGGRDGTSRLAWALRGLAAAREHRPAPAHPDLLDGLPAASSLARELRYWLLLTASVAGPRSRNTSTMADLLLTEPTIADDVEARWRCVSLALAAGLWDSKQAAHLREERRKAWVELRPYIQQDVDTYLGRADLSIFSALER